MNKKREEVIDDWIKFRKLQLSDIESVMTTATPERLIELEGQKSAKLLQITKLYLKY